MKSSFILSGDELLEAFHDIVHHAVHLCHRAATNSRSEVTYVAYLDGVKVSIAAWADGEVNMILANLYDAACTIKKSGNVLWHQTPLKNRIEQVLIERNHDVKKAKSRWFELDDLNMDVTHPVLPQLNAALKYFISPNPHGPAQAPP